MQGHDKFTLLSTRTCGTRRPSTFRDSLVFPFICCPAVNLTSGGRKATPSGIATSSEIQAHPFELSTRTCATRRPSTPPPSSGCLPLELGVGVHCHTYASPDSDTPARWKPALSLVLGPVCTMFRKFNNEKESALI